MTTSTVALNPHSARRFSDPQAAALKYRLDVVANSVVDVVRSAGGWLYDRVAAGWEVTVLLPQHGDTRPLQILGVHALELKSRFAPTSTAWVSQRIGGQCRCVRDQFTCPRVGVRSLGSPFHGSHTLGRRLAIDRGSPDDHRSACAERGGTGVQGPCAYRRGNPRPAGGSHGDAAQRHEGEFASRFRAGTARVIQDATLEGNQLPNGGTIGQLVHRLVDLVETDSRGHQ